MRFIAIVLLSLLAATGAKAHDFYNFNKSLVQVMTDGQQMRIVYVTPGPGLPKFIRPGSLIFEGGINESTKKIEGYAHVYDICGPQKIWVSGTESSGGAVLEFIGMMGFRDKRRCNAGGFVDETSLRFVKGLE